ncbi:MAG: hypothetical protein KJ600_03900 [Nanoarchaeota archaeon]|nr:hypothetical protein [Nanoarchaeota archaeon]MBU1103671.1 hypothetical protein [Nanoarchaeota archaeon]
MVNEFWKSYKNKTKLEERAISSIKQAMNFLFSNIPENKIVSVYIEGTFVTREMTKRSDIDIVPIIKDNRTLKKLQNVRNKNKEMLRPSELLPISLTELKQNKNAKHRGPLKGRPDTFLRDLEHYKLVYGKKLSKPDYPVRSANKMFSHELKTLKNRTIALHKKGEYGFSQLIKQVFWIVFYEQKRLGGSPPRTWNGLNKFVKNKNHIIHKAYHFRKHPTKDKRKRAGFIRSLEAYLEKIS